MIMKKVIFLFLSLVVANNALAADEVSGSEFSSMTFSQRCEFLKQERIALRQEREEMREKAALMLEESERIVKESETFLSECIEKAKLREAEDSLVKLTLLLLSSGEIRKLPPNIKCFSREDPEKSGAIESFICKEELYPEDLCELTTRKSELFFGVRLLITNDIASCQNYIELLGHHKTYIEFKNKATKEDTRIFKLNNALLKHKDYKSLDSKVDHLEKRYREWSHQEVTKRVLVKRLRLIQSIINFIDASFLSIVDKVSYLQDFQARVKSPFEKGLLEEAINYTYSTSL